MNATVSTHTSVHMRSGVEIRHTLTDNGTAWISLGDAVSIFIKDTEQIHRIARELGALGEALAEAERSAAEGG